MTPERRGRLPRRAAFVALIVFATLVAPGATAQSTPESPPPSEVASSALDQAQAALATARASTAPASPDVAVWAAAIDAAREAVASAGDAPGPAALRVLAEAYQGAGWWVRALDVWNRLADAHGPLIGTDLRAWRDATTQFAYARYQAGDLAVARDRFAAILEVLPDDREALRWSGRIALEQDDPAAAIGYWQRLLAGSPDDEGARFYLDLARERLAHGREASDAYRDGLQLLEADRVDDAIDAFERAERAAPAWIDPLRWRARTLFEAGRPEAVAAWQQVVDLRPDDEGASWFLARAKLQAEVGRDARIAADEANAATLRGEPARALTAWQRAVEEAPSWLEARLGVARSATAAGEAAVAERAWQQLIAAVPDGDPLRAEARQGLAMARLLGRLEPDVARAYVAAEAAFERGEVDEAVGLLREVVARAPDAVEAWAFLGRIAFAQADWPTAARAYERASELDPADSDLAFFASEARALAGPAADANEDEGEGR